MKARSASLFTSGFVATLLVCGTSALAQTVDRSTGTVLDSSTAPATAPGTTARPPVLTASLAAAAEGGKIAGTLKFSMAGNAANVTGRIEGLEPNKTYQLALGPVKADADAAQDPTDGKDVAPPPSQAGPPDAGKPVAPSPAAGTPDAGQPNGESRPGAPGGGTEDTPATGSRNPHPALKNADTAPETAVGDGDAIGSVVADSTGAANVNAVLRNEATADSLQNLAGRTVMVRGGEATDMKTVAWGVIAGAVGTPANAKPTGEAKTAPADR